MAQFGQERTILKPSSIYVWQLQDHNSGIRILRKFSFQSQDFKLAFKKSTSVYEYQEQNRIPPKWNSSSRHLKNQPFTVGKNFFNFK